MKMYLQDFPGFFGVTSQGVIAIHADWPMYPEEHGADLALLWLTAFPSGTTFRRIDDIDRCSLLLVELKHSNLADPFSVKSFHIAIWHKDLLQLQSNGFVDGVSPVSERRWQEIQRSNLPSGPLSIELGNGTYEEIHLPMLEEYDDEDISWPDFSQSGLVITPSGRNYASTILTESSNSLMVHNDRIQKLFELGFFDTAVREACINLEHSIKTWLNSNRWGEVLVEDFVSQARSSKNWLESHIRVLRAQIRTVFKFIRNDFMHNFVGIDEMQCRAILFRVARVQTIVNQVINTTCTKGENDASNN